MMAFIGFPLLLISFAIYNIIAFLMPGVSWTATLFSVQLISTETLSLSGGDLLIAVSMLFLFLEIVKWGRLGARFIVDHLLAVLLFIVMLIEFLVVRQAATPTFFLLLVLSFVDVIGGFSVTIRSAQRQVTIESEHAPAA
jgi:hypothetical protein